MKEIRYEATVIECNGGFYGEIAAFVGDSWVKKVHTETMRNKHCANIALRNAVSRYNKIYGTKIPLPIPYRELRTTGSDSDTPDRARLSGITLRGI